MDLYARNLDPLRGLKCPVCGYELTGLSNYRCPECGTPFDPAHLDSAPAKRVGPVGLMTTWMCATLMLLCTFSNAVTIVTNICARCGTPTVSAVGCHTFVVPVLFIPMIAVYLKARQAGRDLFVCRFPLVISSAAWGTIFVVLAGPRLF
jgi:predicted amidophosphoribosyltransferase